jgi:hypothetical protein
MARVRSTARVERDGDETEATETVPISEAMRRSGLVSSEDTPAAEATQADAEEDEIEDEYGAMPSKPSHLEPKPPEPKPPEQPPEPKPPEPKPRPPKILI